jgi:hypothetical protein
MLEQYSLRRWDERDKMKASKDLLSKIILISIKLNDLNIIPWP